MAIKDNVVLLIGGVGGAKLAKGLSQLLPLGNLTIIVNTGDDFSHLGLKISPDIDTVMYTLAGLSHQGQGWGLEGDTHLAMGMIRKLGGPDWFGLGDRDIGTNLFRTSLLEKGVSLSEVTRRIGVHLGVAEKILPMTDDEVRTKLVTDIGYLGFQEYFVKHHWQPMVREIIYESADEAHLTEDTRTAMANASLIIIGPSNPYLSIDPILSISGFREALNDSPAPCISLCPIIGGKAVKGPTTKLMVEFGVEPSPDEIANHYRSIIDGIMIDESDKKCAGVIEGMGIRVGFADILMKDDAEKMRCAGDLLSWALEVFD